jgi:hypothetical protein
MTQSAFAKPSWTSRFGRMPCVRKAARRARIALTQSWGAIVQGLETQYRNAMATPRTAPRWATA